MTNKVTPDWIQRIIQNEQLRNKIVDLADWWDRKESLKYGQRLRVLLSDLGIHDIPDVYKTIGGKSNT